MTWLLVAVVCVLTSAGQVAQKLAVSGHDTRPGAVLRSPWMWLGLLCLGLGLIVWLLVLQRLDVGIAYPMLSLNFVLVTLAARFLLREPVDWRHACGIALIVAGVACIGFSS
jgi:undecaprenyl phosphate-alpha-L-ara4N flippase subunit ArnE